MSRFADPSLTATVDLGACQCPGTPHDRDTVEVRTELGASALARVGRAEINAAVTGDHFASYRQLVEEAAIEWNLLHLSPAMSDDEERIAIPAPINKFTIELLDELTLRAIAEAIDQHTSGGPDPNGSGARLRGSRRARQSVTQTTTQKPGT